MPLAGWAAVRVGSDRVCRWAAFGYCALLPVLALAPGNALFVAGLFCFGAVHGVLDVAMNLQAVEVERGYDRPIMSSSTLCSALAIDRIADGWSGGGCRSRAAPAFLDRRGPAHRRFGAFHLSASREEDRTGSPSFLMGRQSRFNCRPADAILASSLSCHDGRRRDGRLERDLPAHCGRAGEGVAAAGYAAFSVAMAIGRFTGDRLTLRFGPVNLVRAADSSPHRPRAGALFGTTPHRAGGFAIVGAGFATVVPVVFSASGRSIAGVSTSVISGFSSARR